MANNNFNSTVAALFQGMDGIVSSKTVVGDATVTAVSETKAQYGLDADGNYRIRFVTA